MKRRGVFACCIALVLLIISPIAFLVPHKQASVPAGTSAAKSADKTSMSMSSYSILENCDQAKYAFVGRVVSREPTTCGLWDISPYTPIVFEVEERIKGNPPMQVTFREAGGQMGSIVFMDWGNHHYQPGERAVLFIKENGYPISGGSEFQITDGVVILPEDYKLEGSSIPACQPRDENGWVIFSQQQFIHYLKSLCRFMPS